MLENICKIFFFSYILAVLPENGPYLSCFLYIIYTGIRQTFKAFIGFDFKTRNSG